MMSHLIGLRSSVKRALVIALSVALFSVSGVVAAQDCVYPHARRINTLYDAPTQTQTIRAAGAIAGLLAGLATFDSVGAALSASSYLFAPPGLAILSGVAVGVLTAWGVAIALSWIAGPES